jgi:cation:H+ antiporter
MALAFILLAASLFLVIKSAGYAIYHSSRLAEGFNLPKYVIGFIIVAVISILPETFISVTSASKGIPAFGLSTLFGSNVADLTLVFAMVILISGRKLKVESKIIDNRFLYIALITLPLFFGSNGYYSRIEGALLILAGLAFYVFILKDSKHSDAPKKERPSVRNILLLLLSMVGLLIGSNLTVRYGVSFAGLLGVSPVIIGMFVVGLGTVLPEASFAIRAARHRHDGLALGDILGTVIADATIVVGIVAVISPFAFSRRIVYITGAFMLFSIILLLHFMKTGKVLDRKEAVLLLFSYAVFVAAELTANYLE